MGLEELIRRLGEKTEELRTLLPAEQVHGDVRAMAAKYKARRLAEGETRSTAELMAELTEKYR